MPIGSTLAVATPTPARIGRSEMLDLPTVLRRCREVVAYHHSLTMPDLVAAIDAHLGQLEAAAPSRGDQAPEETGAGR